MKNLFTTIAASATLLFASSAFANPVSTPLQAITGQIDFTGGAIVKLSGGSITEIDFFNPQVEASTTSGSFSSAIGQTVDFIDPFVVATPTTQLWTVAGFSFDLLDILVNKEVDFDNNGKADYAIIQGSGMIHGNGYESTSGQWSFSTQGFNGLGQGGKFSFSSSTIPEPATIALLGLGLVGFGAARRNKKA